MSATAELAVSRAFEITSRPMEEEWLIEQVWGKSAVGILGGSTEDGEVLAGPGDGGQRFVEHAVPLSLPGECSRTDAGLPRRGRIAAGP